MKKNILSLIILATVAVMATAQPTMRAFTAGGATVNNSYGVVGQPFGDILAANGYEVSEGVAQMQLVRDTTVVLLLDGDDYTWVGNGFIKEYTNVHDTIDSVYQVNGGVYNYDVVHYLYIVTCDKTVADADASANIEYDVVILGGYCWTKQNLRHSTGNEMIYNSDLYPADQIDLTKYGYLYTWADATDGPVVDNHIQGICPEGWHIPDETEMGVVDRQDAAAIRTTTDWTSGGVNNNRTGFSAYPAGEFSASYNRFQGMGTSTDWWTTTNTGSMATSLQVNYYCNVPMFKQHDVNDGLSVRCVLIPDIPVPVRPLFWRTMR